MERSKRACTLLRNKPGVHGIHSNGPHLLQEGDLLLIQANQAQQQLPRQAQCQRRFRVQQCLHSQGQLGASDLQRSVSCRGGAHVLCCCASSPTYCRRSYLAALELVMHMGRHPNQGQGASPGQNLRGVKHRQRRDELQSAKQQTTAGSPEQSFGGNCSWAGGHTRTVNNCAISQIQTGAAALGHPRPWILCMV
jgi:hypothetical protein